MAIVIGQGITIGAGVTINSEINLDGDLMIMLGTIDLMIEEGPTEDLEA